MKLKPPAETFDFKRKFIERAKVLSGRKYAKAHLMIKILRQGRGFFLKDQAFFLTIHA
jgi:hypothetical protein